MSGPRRHRIRRRASTGSAPRVQRQMPAQTQALRTEVKDRLSGAADLSIAPANDHVEREADRVADHVMRAPAASSPGIVRRMCADCAEGETEQPANVVRAKSDGGGAGSTAPAGPAAAHAIGALGPGKPMATAERAFFEPRFGADLSAVRVHDDAPADRAARSVGARAFTLGRDIAFARGEPRDGAGGRRLMAHELAHVVQEGRQRILRRAPCTRRTVTSAIVTSHTIGQANIVSPGDQAEITVTFSCRPRSLTSEIVDTNNNVVKSSLATIWNGGLRLSRSGNWVVRWDGKRAFSSVGTFMAADGTYRHRIRDVAYAAGPQGDLVASGVQSTSPAITVGSRAAISGGPAGRQSRHLYRANGTKITANIQTVAEAISGEAGGYSNDERSAIAWAIRNEMAAINSFSAAAADRAFHFANRTPSAADRTLAESILSQDLANDPTSGAIKWYSPRSMPPNAGQCSTAGGDRECGGGLVTLASDPQRSSYAPGFHTHMTHVAVPGVREWNFRFYRL